MTIFLQSTFTEKKESRIRKFTPCAHGRIRSTYKDCGGSQICAHGMIKSACKLCKTCIHLHKTIDCSECCIRIEDTTAKGGDNIHDYGPSETNTTMIKLRTVNGIECSQAHIDATFGWHADGIEADFYVRGIVRKDLGSPPLILDYSLSCDSDQSKSLGSGYNISYLIRFY